MPHVSGYEDALVGCVLWVSDSRRRCGKYSGRENISARGMMLGAAVFRRSCVYYVGKDRMRLLKRGGAEVGGVGEEFVAGGFRGFSGDRFVKGPSRDGTQVV